MLGGIHFTAVLCHPGSTKDGLNDFPGVLKCLREIKVYRENKLCGRIYGQSLVLTRCVCLIWSIVLVLSGSVFPGWTARHDPPDDCL